MNTGIPLIPGIPLTPGKPLNLGLPLTPGKPLEFLLIRRKDTIGYIEFMRGKYAINNKLYIKNILSEMTVYERQRLLDNDLDTLWHNLWGDFVSNQFRSEEKNARDKFEALKLGLVNYSLESLMAEVETRWLEPEWGFPKGRHNNMEKDLICGLREFEEETGYPTHCVNVIQNLMPYEEIFTGSNYKSYKHKYYVGQIDFSQKPNKSFQTNEISKIEWCTYERALELIRPYNLEKLEVLRKVNKVLRTYNITTTF
jgi:8-oxo-dGTP pyrophosphatase MutT (NUDIX family)